MIENESKRPSALTEFEREHFHPLNVTPERPCMAYFNVGDNAIATKEIFEALRKDDIPVQALCCLQRQPNGSVLIPLLRLNTVVGS